MVVTEENPFKGEDNYFQRFLVMAILLFTQKYFFIISLFLVKIKCSCLIMCVDWEHNKIALNRKKTTQK